MNAPQTHTTLDRWLASIVFDNDNVPTPGDMDYKDHAAAWSLRIEDYLYSLEAYDLPEDHPKPRRLIDRARELGLLDGADCPRAFLAAIAYMREVRYAERRGYRPGDMEVPC